MSVALRSAFGRALRRAALPLGWYYAVTLAVPLANGAAHTGGVFLGHALTVLVVPPILIGFVCTAGVVARRIAAAWWDAMSCRLHRGSLRDAAGRDERKLSSS
jgi:hypothetical protein